MGKSKKWFYSFISNWEECRDRGIISDAYNSNITELYNLCVADIGKS